MQYPLKEGILCISDFSVTWLDVNAKICTQGGFKRLFLFIYSSVVCCCLYVDSNTHTHTVPTRFHRQPWTHKHRHSIIQMWTVLTVNCLIVDLVWHLQLVTLPHMHKYNEKRPLPPFSNCGRPWLAIYVFYYTSVDSKFMFADENKQAHTPLHTPNMCTLPQTQPLEGFLKSFTSEHQDTDLKFNLVYTYIMHVSLRPHCFFFFFFHSHWTYLFLLSYSSQVPTCKYCNQKCSHIAGKFVSEYWSGKLCVHIENIV